MLQDKMEYLYNMSTFPTIPQIPSVTPPTITPPVMSSGVQPPSIPKLPDVPQPKLPLIPTKIDVKNGSGVPGGFSGASVKIPSVELKSLSESKTKITSQLSELNSAQSKLNNLSKFGDPNKLAPGVSEKLTSMKTKLTSQLNGLNKKSADISKSAVDFTKAGAIPPMPSVPKISVPTVDIPKIPPIPSVPTVSGIPTVPNLPQISPQLPKI